MPPYNEFATLSPKKPRLYAETAEKRFLKNTSKEIEIIIVDANDIGVNILGAKNKNQEKLGEVLCFDNPMGQGSEGTPAMLCRKNTVDTNETTVRV
jgi:F420-0:gamma-glutamyl ligase